MADTRTRLVIIDKGKTTDGKDCIQMELVGKEQDVVYLLLHLMASQKQLEHLIMKTALMYGLSGRDIKDHIKEHSTVVNKLGGDDN